MGTHEDPSKGGENAEKATKATKGSKGSKPMVFKPVHWVPDGKPPFRLTEPQQAAMRAMWRMLYEKAVSLALAERAAQMANQRDEPLKSVGVSV